MSPKFREKSIRKSPIYLVPVFSFFFIQDQNTLSAAMTVTNNIRNQSAVLGSSVARAKCSETASLRSGYLCLRHGTSLIGAEQTGSPSGRVDAAPITKIPRSRRLEKKSF